jgi:hypothetical protein
MHSLGGFEFYNIPSAKEYRGVGVTLQAVEGIAFGVSGY